MSRLVVLVVLASCAHSSPHHAQHVDDNDCAVSAAPVIDAVGGLAAAMIGIPHQVVTVASTIYEMDRAARCNAFVAEAPAPSPPHATSISTSTSSSAEPRRAYGSVEALMRR